MRIFNKIAIGLVIAAAVPSAAAQGREEARLQAVPTAVTDSVSTAFATVWGGYILDMLDKEFPGDDAAISRFADGVAAAFDLPRADAPYYQGILQGYTVLDRLAQMRELGFPVGRDAFVAALRRYMGGEPTGFTSESADTYLNGYMSRQYEAQMAADTLSVASQQAFLDSQARREGVVRTPDGLLFEVITEGEGDGPTMDDQVAITYTGRLYNGTIFDQADTPTLLPLKGLVSGFSEGLLMMKPGGTYRIIIPSDLGYGPRGTAGVIPGNAALDFTITLHDIIKK